MSMDQDVILAYYSIVAEAYLLRAIGLPVRVHVEFGLGWTKGSASIGTPDFSTGIMRTTQYPLDIEKSGPPITIAPAPSGTLSVMTNWVRRARYPHYFLRKEVVSLTPDTERILRQIADSFLAMHGQPPSTRALESPFSIEVVHADSAEDPIKTAAEAELADLMELGSIPAPQQVKHEVLRSLGYPVLTRNVTTPVTGPNPPNPP